jgi:hypothetical protein
LKPEANKTLLFRAGPLLPLLVLTFGWQIAASAGVLPATVQPAGGIHSLGAAASFTGDLDCLIAREIEETPAPVCDNSPNPWNDRDEISPSPNQEARIPSRNDHLFSSFRLHPSSLSLPRSAGTVPAFFFPAHFSDSLHELIRERAPPSLT